MCRCGECFGCTPVLTERDPGDEQPVKAPLCEVLGVKSWRCPACDSDQWCEVTTEHELWIACDDCGWNDNNDAPCPGCVERCGQCSES